MTNSAKRPKYTDYKVKVIADIDNLSGKANISNSGGHLLPDGDIVKIEGIEYVVVRSYEQLLSLREDKKNLAGNYIFAKDIVGDENCEPMEFNDFTGILDGNNYRLGIAMNDYFIKFNAGIIKNIILDNGKNEERISSMPADGTGYQFVEKNASLIKNCVNKNMIYRPTMGFLRTFAQHGYPIIESDNTTATIAECINYGELSARNAMGIGSAEIISMCVNVGDIASIYTEDEIVRYISENRAVGVSDGTNEISNCANLGKIVGRNLASGIEIGARGHGLKPIMSVTYNINYGELVSGDSANALPVLSDRDKIIIGNLNYGKLVGKEFNKQRLEIFKGRK